MRDFIDSELFLITQFAHISFIQRFPLHEKLMERNPGHKESPAIINIFKKNLEKNRSEFRFLPDEDEVDKDFESK
jgi:hypothetical protein